MTNLASEIPQLLSKFAYKRSIPFCYSCYKEAPTGKCSCCFSDDLMRLLPGIGYEYGIDWVIKEPIQERLTKVSTSDEFEEEIRRIYPETTQVGWLTLDTIDVIKTLDPVSWSLAQSEWIDNALEEGVITFDNGNEYYRSSEVEYLMREFESEH